MSISHLNLKQIEFNSSFDKRKSRMVITNFIHEP